MPRLNRRNVLTTLVIGGASLSLAACGMGGQGGPTTTQAPVSTGGTLSGEITFQTWSLKNEKFTPYFEKVVKDFQDAHPGTTIKWVDQPGDGYADKVMQQATAGQLPDVVNLPPDFAFPLVKAGKLMDLKKADSAAIDTLPPAASRPTSSTASRAPSATRGTSAPT